MPFLPPKLQRSIAAGTKNALVATNRSTPLRFFGKRAYDAMELVIRLRFGSVKGVRAVYLCHSLPAGECYPGLSDFDLAIVFGDRDTLGFYDRIRRRWGSLKRYFPISDLSILTVGEFDTWQRIGGGWDPLDEVRHWKLIAGDELRHGNFDATAEQASLDRMQWALGHFQNLLGVAIKEEQKSPLMAVIARRQLHKYFWNAVLALDAKYLAVPAHGHRVSLWLRDHGVHRVVEALQAMHGRRFLGGPVTTVRFDAAALAWKLLDDSLSANPLLARPLFRPVVSDSAAPIVNFAEVDERASAICVSVLEMLAGRIESIVLSSTGSVRGYTLYIVLRDGLSLDEIADALRDIRAIHRVFDDPWFNEHFPAGIPTVCSRSMFLARLQTGRSSLDYFESFRRVLHGRDLYAEAVENPGDTDVRAIREHDWQREHLLYSLHLHQVYLAWLRPALHDYVTFYLPRLMLQRNAGIAPATAEQAVDEFARSFDERSREMPRQMLEAYRGKDLDALLKTMTRETFANVWPLLRQGLHTQMHAL
ncbi:MAG: hypothetical protein ACSLFK_09015 [Gemmatimonadaceae bacterium]